MSADPFTIGLMVAGSVVDIFQTGNQQGIIEAGRRVEQAAFETNMQALITQSNQAAAADSRKLRENIGSQIVNNAAKGTASGAGNAFGGIQKSVAAVGQNEQVRKINLLAQQSQLTAGHGAAQLESFTTQSQLSQQLTKRIFNQVTTASSGGMLGGSK